MRRFWTTMLVIAMALVIALPAGAGRPEKPDKPEEPTTEPPTLSPCLDSETFSGSGVHRFECDWTPSDPGTDNPEGVIRVEKQGSGEVSHLVVMVRDSSPGDICELDWEGKTIEDSEWYVGPLTSDLDLTFPLSDDDRGTYWEFEFFDNFDIKKESNGEHWCGPYDPIDGLRDDLNGDPLHLAVNMRAKKDTTVTITLSQRSDS